MYCSFIILFLSCLRSACEKDLIFQDPFHKALKERRRNFFLRIKDEQDRD